MFCKGSPGKFHVMMQSVIKKTNKKITNTQTKNQRNKGGKRKLYYQGSENILKHSHTRIHIKIFRGKALPENKRKPTFCCLKQEHYDTRKLTCTDYKHSLAQTNAHINNLVFLKGPQNVVYMCNKLICILKNCRERQKKNTGNRP